MKKGCIIFLLIFLVLKINANTFEGQMTIVKQTIYDTTYYTIYVSKEKIRIDEKNNRKELKNIYLINNINDAIYIIDPTRKMQFKLKEVASKSNNDSQYEIKKTNNSKTINGIKCYQWRVKNTEKNTEITYWVVYNNTDFFQKIIKVLNYNDASWDFFSAIPQNEKKSFKVIDIQHKKIDSTIFRISKDYNFLWII